MWIKLETYLQVSTDYIPEDAGVRKALAQIPGVQLIDGTLMTVVEHTIGGLWWPGHKS